MKRKLLLCSISIVLLSAGVVSAKSSSYENLTAAANWSNSRAPREYKNILAAASWSRLSKSLSAGLTRRSASTSRLENSFDEETMFAGPTWKFCVYTCVSSVMGGAGTVCVSGCASCGAAGSVWGCAVCASCGAVGFATIELCVLHCCVNPGCPAPVSNGG